MGRLFMDNLGREVTVARGDLHSAFRTHRTSVGTGAAPDTEFLIQHRNQEVFAGHGAGWAHPRALATGDTFRSINQSMHAVRAISNK